MKWHSRAWEQIQELMRPRSGKERPMSRLCSHMGPLTNRRLSMPWSSSPIWTKTCSSMLWTVSHLHFNREESWTTLPRSLSKSSIPCTYQRGTALWAEVWAPTSHTRASVSSTYIGARLASFSGEPRMSPPTSTTAVSSDVMNFKQP